MLVVVALISLMVGISFPPLRPASIRLRLNAATNSVVSFFNSGLDRAERRQQVVEISISEGRERALDALHRAGFFRKLELPDGVSITHVLPELPANRPPERRAFSCCIRAATVPRFGVQLINRRNVERIVRVDPITGVPRVERSAMKTGMQPSAASRC